MAKEVDAIGHLFKPNLVRNLKTILHSATFCTVCFDEREGLLPLDSYVVIKNSEEEVVTVREMFEAIFGNGDILISDYVCEPCKSIAWASFQFINKTKQNALIFTNYLEQIEKETSELAAQPVEHEWKNVMIILNHHEKNETQPNRENGYTCDLCSKKYSRRSFLIKHLKKHEMASKVDCLHCGHRSCIHEKYLVAFYQQKMSKEVLTCIECGYKFGKSLPHLIAHVNKEHLDIKTNICEECGQSFYLESHYKRHYELQHGNKHVCMSCFRKFKSIKHLESHALTCNGSENFRFHKSYGHSQSKVTDLQPTHIGYNKRLLKRNDTRRRNRTYKCLTCNDILRTKLELRAHIKKKHEKKPNLCLYCNKQFGSRQEYLVHVQTQEHRENIPYNAFKHNCSYCDYSASTLQMLKAHVNRVHLNIRPFECEFCQKRYFDSTQLKNHVKTHTGQRKAKVCDICGAHLAGPTALKKHRRLHTGENPYSCPYCDVKTNCTSTLKTHIMRKHMAPTIACPLCDLTFHTMNNARGHVRKTHWKSKEKFDFTKLKGLSPEDYDFFRDRRKALV